MTSPTNQGHIKTRSDHPASRGKSHQEETPTRTSRANLEPSRATPQSNNQTARHTMHPPVPCLGGTFSIQKRNKLRGPRGCSSPGPPAVDFGTASPRGRLPVRRPGGDRRSRRTFVRSVPQSEFSADDGGVKRTKQRQAGTFFTERSLAAYLSVSDRTIRNWIRRGELPSYKLGASRRIDPADVEDFLARHRDEAA